MIRGRYKTIEEGVAAWLRVNDLRAQGRTGPEISRETGIPRATVHRWVKKQEEWEPKKDLPEWLAGASLDRFLDLSAGFILRQVVRMRHAASQMLESGEIGTEEYLKHMQCAAQYEQKAWGVLGED